MTPGLLLRALLSVVMIMPLECLHISELIRWYDIKLQDTATGINFSIIHYFCSLLKNIGINKNLNNVLVWSHNETLGCHFFLVNNNNNNKTHANITKSGQEMIDTPVTRVHFSTFSKYLLYFNSHCNCVRIYSLQNCESQCANIKVYINSSK